MRTKQLETNPKFIKMEIIERTNMYLMEKYNPNITINKYTDVQHKEEYDIIFSSGNTILEEICEIKTRYYNSTQFNDYILEKRKYDSLIKKYDDFLYAQFFFDRLLIWKLHSECDYNWEEKIYKKYTGRESSYEKKICLMLNREDAIVDEPIPFTYEEVEKIAEKHFNKKYKHLIKK